MILLQAISRLLIAMAFQGTYTRFVEAEDLILHPPDVQILQPGMKLEVSGLCLGSFGILNSTSM